jgi:hypothetical protein
MPYPEQPFPSSLEPIAFPIIKSSGQADNEFYVGDGVCYSTYSLETGSFLNIQNLNTPFSWERDQKIYIEIDVAMNLGAKKAVIKNEFVGEAAPEDGWKNYPYFYKIEPQDDFNNGRVTKVRDGKRQLKCYVLIGYLSDDSNKNGDGIGGDESESSNSDAYDPVQILKENILLVPSIVSGVPCLAPFPYFKGGLTHLLAIKTDLEAGAQESENGEGGNNEENNT